jgi:hypothetical protein
MNELSYDQLLKIEYNHPITCPIINSLKFCGEMSSKVYEVSIDYDPTDLMIDIKELIDTINRLDSWASGILDNINKLPDNIRKEIKIKDKFFEYYHTDYKNDLKEYSSNINSLISSWLEYIKDKEEFVENFKICEEEIKNLEKKLLILKVNGQDTTDTEELIEFYKNELIEFEDKNKDCKHFFERYVKEDFEKEVNDFSNFLEIVRERNDNLRTYASDLRKELIKNGKDHLRLYQPEEYLNKKYPVKEREINIGVIFNNIDTDSRTPFSSYFNALKRISNKGGLTFLEKEEFADLYNKVGHKEILEKLVNTLKDKGFKVIRYYIDSDSYLKNKDSYITENLTAKNLNLNKIK